MHKSADINLLAEIADKFINETGRNVCLLCFNTGLEDDVSVANQVYGIMKNKHMTEIIRYKDINDMLKNIKRCGAILGIRFHSAMLALRMGVYDVNNIDTDEVLKSILNAVPYKLDGNIIKSAENHIKRFDEYIKRQC